MTVVVGRILVSIPWYMKIGSVFTQCVLFHVYDYSTTAVTGWSNRCIEM